MTIGSIKFKSSEQFLVEQFEWAKEMEKMETTTEFLK